MKHYRLWVRLPNGTTTHTVIIVENDCAAKQLGETIFGKGNILNWTRASE